MSQSTTPNSTKKTLVTGGVIFILVVILAAGIFVARHLAARGAQQGPIIEMPPFEKVELTRNAFPQVTGEAREAFNPPILHEGSHAEWWYVNAHLMDDMNRRFTMMMTFLKSGLTFFVFSDIEGRKSYSVVKEGKVVVNPVNNALRILNYRIMQPDPSVFCYTFQTDLVIGSMNLEICANKPPLVSGNNGEIRMGKTGVSQYYSLSNCTVKGVGTFHNQPVRFRGWGWIDRQWGNWKTGDFNQWQWFSIQLENNMELMVFKFTRNGKSITPLAEIVYPDGRQEHNVRYQMRTLDNWISPKTGVSWSSGWEIDILDKDIKLSIMPDFPDQEVNEALWEGGCRVVANINGQKVHGRAFYEERRLTWEDRRRSLMGQGIHVHDPNASK